MLLLVGLNTPQTSQRLSNITKRYNKLSFITVSRPGISVYFPVAATTNTQENKTMSKSAEDIVSESFRNDEKSPLNGHITVTIDNQPYEFKNIEYITGSDFNGLIGSLDTEAAVITFTSIVQNGTYLLTYPFDIIHANYWQVVIGSERYVAKTGTLHIQKTAYATYFGKAVFEANGEKVTIDFDVKP
ncbi:hypothetical protein [Pseudomonas sp. PDM27]|uniref:hypothetical protein n=1 Tax=Pseudomonas sp. PDM27 TaxID=2854769 RepID=UPI001C48045D|nr:hypothetical protein [Pseudomonas sp. PDM27]MBV7570106.1 hypothetical protein [Pseudomonas sp. PDM27]